jgi:hypothetical protein
LCPSEPALHRVGSSNEAVAEPSVRVLLIPKKPASTPQELREESQRAMRLAEGTTDEKAKTALLAYARELLEKAAQLEAAATAGIAPAGATAQAPTKAQSKRDPET